MNPQLSPWRAARVFIRLRIKRLLNMVASGILTGGRRKSKTRTPTPGKRKFSLVTAGFFGLIFLAQFTSASYLALDNMQEALTPSRGTKTQTGNTLFDCVQDALEDTNSNPKCQPAVQKEHTLSPYVRHAASIELALLFLVVLFITLASRELSRPGWDLKWLFTLPMPLQTLLGVRMAERAVVNPVAYIALWPFLMLLAWHTGYSWATPFIALLFTLLLSLIAATLQTVADTALRLIVAPAKLRNLQAMLSIVAILTFLPAYSVVVSETSFVFTWAELMPEELLWLPPGLAVQALTTTSPASFILFTATLIVQTGLIAAAGTILLKKQLRFGVIAASTRESGRKTTALQRTKRLLKPSGPRKLFTPIQSREIRLLGRDRNFLVQTLVLPVVIVGMQFFFQPKETLTQGLANNPTLLAALAFGIGAYALMFSAFQTLNAEGKALWVLYTTPHSLESILQQKALFWMVLTLLYPIVLFTFGLTLTPNLTPEFLALIAIVLAGLPIYAAIATALGVFACDPLAEEQQHKVRVDFTYLYFLLAGFYTYAIFANGFFQRITLMILCGFLAVALWQKAKDHLPYLLDPTASPPHRVSVSDGLITALMFFVLQGMCMAIAISSKAQPSVKLLTICFAIAGALTYGLTRYVFWRSKTTGVPKILGKETTPSLVWGIATGTLAGLFALLYMKGIIHFHLLEDTQNQVIWTEEHTATWLILLVVIAAPIFEEFIFRGLLFQGLKRSTKLPTAILASAAIFAIVHPPPAVLPVFGLGLAAAYAYHRTKLLLAPMLAHATYNAIVVMFSAW